MTAGRCSELVGVSIRSPHRSKGRLTSRHAITARPPSCQFQSAPLTEARGDHWCREFLADALIATRFQSAPLTEARGDVKY